MTEVIITIPRSQIPFIYKAYGMVQLKSERAERIVLIEVIPDQILDIAKVKLEYFKPTDLFYFGQVVSELQARERANEIVRETKEELNNFYTTLLKPSLN